MIFKNFNDVQPNDKANFIMTYSAINRALSRLEYSLRKTYNGYIPYYIFKELLKIHQKSNQMAAIWKNKK